MPALAYHEAVARDYGPHERVRRDRVTPALGEAAGKIHHRILQHVFLSPIRTLTVGAGLRLATHANLHRLNLPRGSRALQQGRKTTLPGSPPVREFHPPPKVADQRYHTVTALTRKHFAVPHAQADASACQQVSLSSFG
jgi:hypothetical protein